MHRCQRPVCVDLQASQLRESRDAAFVCLFVYVHLLLYSMYICAASVSTKHVQHNSGLLNYSTMCKCRFTIREPRTIWWLSARLSAKKRTACQSESLFTCQMDLIMSCLMLPRSVQL